MGRRWAIIAAALALGGSAAATWHPSSAAFSSASAVPGTNWEAGSVAIATPASGLINVSGAIPGSFGARCFQIDYTGTVPATVRMYLRPADLGGTGLSNYLTLQIDAGSGAQTDCADFATSVTLWNTTGLSDASKTAAAFSTASPGYATGVGNWAVTGPASRTYRVRWQLQDDNAAASKSASVAFTWEAQSS